MRPHKKTKARDYKNTESEVSIWGDAEQRRHSQYLQALHRFPTLGAEEARDLARRYKQENDIAAGDRLVEAHLRMVPRIARRVAEKFGYDPSEDDPKEAWDGYWNLCRELLNAGNEGLLKARDRFDPSRGSSFATCARYSIYKACREEAKWLRSPVRHPQRQPTLSSASLNENIFDDGVETLQDQICAEPAPNLGDLCDIRAMLEATADGLLDPRECKIVRARCLTDKPEKLKQLGAELGITTKRVHQIEQRAIKKLQVHFKRVKAALDQGLTAHDVAAQLNLPLEEVERLRQLVDERFSEEVRYTLTDKAVAMLAYRGKGEVA